MPRLSFLVIGRALLGAMLVACSGSDATPGTPRTFPCTAEGVSNAIAEGGGPHTFDCDGPTTVQPGAELIIERDVALDGGGALTVDGDYGHSLLWVMEGATAELVGLEFRGGSNGAIANNGTLIMADTVVSASEGLIFSNGTLDIARCTVELGFGTLGGAIFNSGGDLTVVDSIIRSSEALDEGGGITNTGAATIVNTRVSTNFGMKDGGGISNTGEMAIEGSEIIGNWGRGSGAIYNHRGATMIVTGTTVWSNETGAADGAAILNEGELMLIDTTVSENAGRDFDGFPFEAASLQNEGGALSLRDTLVSGFCGSVVTSEGNNIESPGDTCGLDHETDQVNVSPDDL